MLYLVEQVQTDTTSLLYEFHRNADGKKEIKKIMDFKPYFFVDERAPVEKWEGVFKTEKGSCNRQLKLNQLERR